VVIPVRVGREDQLPPLPRADELPPEIHYQKHDVIYEQFGRDAKALVEAVTAVRRHLRPETARAGLRHPWGLDWHDGRKRPGHRLGQGTPDARAGVVAFAANSKPVLEPAAAAKQAVLKEQTAAFQKKVEEATKPVPIEALAPGSGKSARDRLTDGSPCSAGRSLHDGICVRGCTI